MGHGETMQMTKRNFALLCMALGLLAMLAGCAPKAEEVPTTEAPKGAAKMAPTAGGPGGAPGASGTQAAKPTSQ